MFTFLYLRIWQKYSYVANAFQSLYKNSYWFLTLKRFRFIQKKFKLPLAACSTIFALQTAGKRFLFWTLRWKLENFLRFFTGNVLVIFFNWVNFFTISFKLSKNISYQIWGFLKYEICNNLTNFFNLNWLLIIFNKNVLKIISEYISWSKYDYSALFVCVPMVFLHIKNL